MYGLLNNENIFDLRWPLTVKGQGQPPKKNSGTLLFQSTIDIRIQNPHKKVGGPLLAALAAAICSLLLPNCEGSHSVRLYFMLHMGWTVFNLSRGRGLVGLTPLVPLNPPSFPWSHWFSQIYIKIHCWPGSSGFTTNRVLGLEYWRISTD